MKHIFLSILIILNPILCLAQEKESNNPLDLLTIEVEGHKVKPTILSSGQNFFVPKKGVYLSKLSYMYLYKFVPQAQKKIDDKKKELDTFYLGKIEELNKSHEIEITNLKNINTGLLTDLAYYKTDSQISEHEYNDRVRKYRWALAISGVIMLSSGAILLLK